MQSYKISQIDLFVAITNELCRQQPGLPADNRSNVVIQAANMIVQEYGREPAPAAPSMGLAAWLRSDEVGASSEYMAWVLSEGDPAIWGGVNGVRFNHPHDADDFGRCVGLIAAAPELADKIHKLQAGHGLEWAHVSKNWQLWSELYNTKQFEKLHDAIELAFGEVSE